MELKEILQRAPGPYPDKELAKASIVADAAMEYLDTLDPKIAAIGTTELARHLGSDIDVIAKWLRLARSQDLLEGYFTKGKPTRGTFGKPSYKWHPDNRSAKPSMTDKERLEWIKQNDPETYAKLYAPKDVLPWQQD